MTEKEAEVERKKLLETLNTAKTAEEMNTAHVALLALAKDFPINELTDTSQPLDPITGDVIANESLVVTSSGCHWDIKALIYFHDTRPFRWSHPPIDLSRNQKWFIDPITGLAFHPKDVEHILSVAKEKGLIINNVLIDAKRAVNIVEAIPPLRFNVPAIMPANAHANPNNMNAALFAPIFAPIPMAPQGLAGFLLSGATNNFVNANIIGIDSIIGSTFLLVSPMFFSMLERYEETLSRRLRSIASSFISSAGTGTLIFANPTSVSSNANVYAMLRQPTHRNLLTENPNSFFEPASPRRTRAQFVTTQLANLSAADLLAMLMIYSALNTNGTPAFESAQTDGEDLYEGSYTPTSPRPAQGGKK